MSRFPDDIEGLRFVVSVLPGVDGKPVLGKYYYNLIEAVNEVIINLGLSKKDYLNTYQGFTKITYILYSWLPQDVFLI